MFKGNYKRTVITIKFRGNIFIVNKMHECNFFSMGNYIRIIMITIGGNIIIIKKKKNENNLFCPKEIALECHNKII